MTRLVYVEVDPESGLDRAPVSAYTHVYEDGHTLVSAFPEQYRLAPDWAVLLLDAAWWLKRQAGGLVWWLARKNPAADP